MPKYNRIGPTDTVPSQHDDVLLRPPHLYSRREVLTRPSPIPKRPGVYAWYLREVPPDVPVDGCHRHDGLPLLYVGISPRRPPSNGNRPVISHSRSASAITSPVMQKVRRYA